MKKLVKMAALSLAVTMFGSSVAWAAFPEGALIIGNKAFELGVLEDEAYTDDINEAILAGGGIYYSIEGITGGYIELDSGKAMTGEQRNELKNIELRRTDGSLVVYETMDDSEPDSQDEFKVIDIH